MNREPGPAPDPAPAAVVVTPPHEELDDGHRSIADRPDVSVPMLARVLER